MAMRKAVKSHLEKKDHSAHQAWLNGKHERNSKCGYYLSKVFEYKNGKMVKV
jgi:hypothetical protein